MAPAACPAYGRRRRTIQTKRPSARSFARSRRTVRRPGADPGCSARPRRDGGHGTRDSRPGLGRTAIARRRVRSDASRLAATPWRARACRWADRRAWAGTISPGSWSANRALDALSCQRESVMRDWLVEGAKHVWRPYCSERRAGATSGRQNARCPDRSGRRSRTGRRDRLVVDGMPRVQPSAHSRSGSGTARSFAARHVRRVGARACVSARHTIGLSAARHLGSRLLRRVRVGGRKSP